MMLVRNWGKEKKREVICQFIGNKDMNCQATSLKSRSERQKIQNSNQYPYFGSYLQGFCFIKCKIEMIFMFYLFIYFWFILPRERGRTEVAKQQKNLKSLLKSSFFFCLLKAGEPV